MTAEGERPTPGGEAHEPPTAFQALCGMLAAQVHMALGYLPDPVDGKTRVELAAARQGIDLLAMLEEKTQGNLEAKETKTLGVLLANLRMVFVERVKEMQAHPEPAQDAPEDEDAPADDGPRIVTP